MALSKNKKESQLVPVLFTIGIIGWGFFAIDRLTSSQIQNKISLKNNFNNISKQKVKKTDSFLQTIKDWIITQLIESKKVTPINSSLSKNNTIPVLLEDDLNLNKIDDPQINEKKKIGLSQQSKQAKVYFYKNTSSGLKLRSVNREIQFKESDNIEKATFNQLFLGPTGQERIKNFLDSFPGKPEVLSVKRNGKIMIINFKKLFGYGLSQQMVKSQLKQLFITAKQFHGISKIKLLLRNKPFKKLGGDSLLIPDVIDETSWLLTSLY